MVDVRRSILTQLRKTKRTRYWLAQQVRGQVTTPGVYRYLSGRSDMSGQKIEKLLDALGLEIRPKR